MRVSNSALVATLIALCSWPSAGRADSLDDSDSTPPKAAKCWSATTQAPYRGLGYDHIVDISNGCDKPIACTVRTSVNPEPSDVTVAAHQNASVVTFRGSPASEFKADVQCKTVETPRAR